MAAERTRASGGRRAANRNGRLSTPRLVRRAIEQVAELTGRPIEGVTAVERADDNWIVTLELVELRRIPDSTDVLATYSVSLDEQGELQEYRRTARYYRSQVEEE